MHRLTNPIRNYSWGSRTHIPKLVGLPITDAPVAEMWFGAHPGAPSITETGESLADVIAAEPMQTLGPRIARQFGARLPFLLKLLAAGEPLSLQVHPTSERARIRFAEEEASGLPAAERNYTDPSHKPELVFALTRFEGMAGFRDTTRSATILRRFQIDWLDELADELEATSTPFQTLRQVVTDLLATKPGLLTSRIGELAGAAKRCEDEGHQPHVRRRPADTPPNSVERESLRLFAQVQSLVARYPDDPGVLVTLLLNHVVLAPGEAMYVSPGMIHAYTSGFGVEVMAASDNVVRAGLTSKHIDIAELLEITNFTPTPPPLWEPTRLRGHTGVVLAPPVNEFELEVVDLEDDEVTSDGGRPVIVLCLQGEASVTCSSGDQTLRHGQAVFAEAADGALTLCGTGRLAIARTPGS